MDVFNALQDIRGVYQLPLAASGVAHTTYDYTSLISPEDNITGEFLFAAQLANESYTDSVSQSQYITMNGDAGSRLYNKINVLPNATIYEPVIQLSENDETIPYYVLLTGTATAYDCIKDLDIMSDYTIHEDLLTAFSNDALNVAQQLLIELEKTDQEIVFVGHSLGCAYIQYIIKYMCQLQPSLESRFQKAYYFNPYILVTSDYTFIYNKCLADSTFRDKFKINIIQNDYASVIFRNKPYGLVYVYPNKIQVSDNQFINELVDRLFGTLLEVLRDNYLDYTNHTITNWTTTYPTERIHKMSGLTEISIQSIYSNSQLQHGVLNNTLLVERQPTNTRVQSKILADIEENNQTLEDFNFTITKGSIRDYYYYSTDNVLKVAFPYTITSGDYSEIIWFLYLSSVVPLIGFPTDHYGLMTMDSNYTKHFNIVSNKIDYKEVFGNYLKQKNQADYFALVQDSAITRTKFLLKAPIDTTNGRGMRRTIEPDFMTDYYWRIKNLYSSQYLIMGYGWGNEVSFTGANNHPITFLNNVDTQNHSNKYYNIDGADEAIWEIEHMATHTFYGIKNTQVQVFLGQTLLNGAGEFSNSDYSSSSASNIQIYMTQINDLGPSEFLMYIIDPTSNLKQYIIGMRSWGSGPDATTVSALALISESNFDLDSYETLTNLPPDLSGLSLTGIDLYKQLVWTFENATTNIAVI